MLLMLMMACGNDSAESPEQKFRYENEQSATYSARVTDSSGGAITGAILSIRADNPSGDTEQIARGVSTSDGTAQIRAVIPTAWTSPTLVVLHPDYEIASASLDSWSSSAGWDSTVSLSLTAK